MKILLAIVLTLTGCLDMGTPYIPNPAAGTWTQVTLPDDGDLKNVASVDVALQALADKQARKLDKISGGTVSGVIAMGNGSALDFGVGSSLTCGVGTTETHNCTETHTGTENHSGTESHTGTETHSGDTTFSNVTSAIAATGPVSISGTNGSFFSGGTAGAQFATPVEVNAKLQLTAGGFLQLGYGTLPDADIDIVIADGQLFVAGAPAWTGNHNVKFKNTGAGAGMFVIVEMLSATAGHNALIKRDDGTTILTMVNSGTPGDKYHGVLYHNGTNWFVGPITTLP